MIQEKDILPNEYRAGGFNVYPTFMIVKFITLLTNESLSSGHILILGRIFGIIFLNFLSILITYHLARIFVGEKPSLVITVLYVFSQFYAMQYWYPDSYLYFGVASVVLFLSRIQFVDTSKINFRLLGISLGIALSTKWTALALLLPIAVVVIPLSIKEKFSLGLWKLNLTFLSYSIGTAVILNLGIFFRFDQFQKGFLFNLQNYGNYPGIRWEGFLFYFGAITVNIFGMFSIPLLIIGLIAISKNLSKYLYLFSYPLLLVLLFGDKQWVVLRNIASAGPFLIPILAIGIASITSLNGQSKVLQNLLGKVLLLSIISLTAFFYFQTITAYLYPNTRIEASNWIRSQDLTLKSIGDNEFCSGKSPVKVAGLESIYDPNFERNLDYYVINSYWDSPLRYKYLEKGILTPFDINKIHFEQWNSTRLFGGFHEVSVQNSDLPTGYYIAKAFYGNGPDIFIIRKR